MRSHLSWCAELVDSLYRNGVRHAVISPGSRSTPLTIAFACHPDIKKTIVLDERSAAFIALGIGKASGTPAALVCTSGTAVANYMPAVVEAKESGVPMVILSADRPPNLRGTGSSQTIDQVKLFGDYAIFFHEAGEPVFEPEDIRRIRYAAVQAVTEAKETGGAAHINLPFRKPLEPEDGEMDAVKKRYRDSAAINPGETLVKRTAAPHGELQELLNRSERPLIIAGPVESRNDLPTFINTLAERRKIPVLAEPGSKRENSQFLITGFEQFLRHPETIEELKPDLLIRTGDQPFTKSVQTALQQWQDIPLISVTADDRWQANSPASEYRVTFRPDEIPVLDGIKPQQDDAWLQRWKKVEKQSADARRQFLDSEKNLTDGHVFDHFGRTLGKNWNVMLSNSFPVRDMAMFGAPSAGQFVNRGAAGIDGITSTAAGLAIASGKSTCCITGDLAFLHDSNALLSLQKMDVSFHVVVINNNGGTIFRMLPVYGNKEVYDTYFETPQQAEISSLAAAYNLPYIKISTIEELSRFDPNSPDPGAVIIECVTDADKSMEIRNRLWSGA